MPSRRARPQLNDFAESLMKTLFLRAFLVVMVFAAGLCFFMGTIEAGSSQDTARKEYADKVRATYNYRFGKDQLAAPGNASIEGDDFVQPGAFPNAKYCAHCHQEAYHQWRQSLHSNSFRTPVLSNQRQHSYQDERHRILPALR